VSRHESVANEAAAALPAVMICIAADLDFATGPVRVHDGVGTIQINGDSFDGVGKFGSVELVEEGIEVFSRPIVLKLSGVEASLIAEATTEIYQGRAVTIYLCLYNPTTQQLVDTPETLWVGKMDTMSVRLAGDQSEVSLRCEHRLRREPIIARYTDADQQLAYPGDRGLELVPKIPGFAGKWGEKDAYVPRHRQPPSEDGPGPGGKARG
jgi:hypothetical protein